MKLNKVPFVSTTNLSRILDKSQEGRLHMTIVGLFSAAKAESTEKAVKQSLTQCTYQTVGISEDSVQPVGARIAGTRQGQLEPEQPSPNSVTAHFRTIRWIRMLDCEENLLQGMAKTGIAVLVVPLSLVLQGADSGSVGKRMG